MDGLYGYKACSYCSTDIAKVYHTGKCPKVKKITYYKDGSIKEVEFFDEYKKTNILNENNMKE